MTIGDFTNIIYQKNGVDYKRKNPRLNTIRQIYGLKP